MIQGSKCYLMQEVDAGCGNPCYNMTAVDDIANRYKYTAANMYTQPNCNFSVIHDMVTLGFILYPGGIPRGVDINTLKSRDKINALSASMYYHEYLTNRIDTDALDKCYDVYDSYGDYTYPCDVFMLQGCAMNILHDYQKRCDSTGFISAREDLLRQNTLIDTTALGKLIAQMIPDKSVPATLYGEMQHPSEF